LGEKIRSKREKQKITLEQLARKAGVSKGLISQIENSRTVPSLPVLFNIIHSLDEDLKTFFETMHDQLQRNKVLLVRKNEEKDFKKNTVKGFAYKRILTETISSETMDFVLLELAKGANRKQLIQTDAYECKFVLKGKIEYQVEIEKFIMDEGDTIFFDGRLKHRLKNLSKNSDLILIVYLF